MLRIRIFGNEVIVFVLRVSRTLQFLLVDGIHQLLVFGLQDKPAEVLQLFVTRIVLQCVLAYDVEAEVVLAKICP